MTIAFFKDYSFDCCQHQHISQKIQVIQLIYWFYLNKLEIVKQMKSTDICIKIADLVKNIFFFVWSSEKRKGFVANLYLCYYQLGFWIHLFNSYEFRPTVFMLSAWLCDEFVVGIPLPALSLRAQRLFEI